MPAERTNEVQYYQAGHPTTHIRYHVVFKQLVLGPVNPAELSLGNMGILDQTPVGDAITGIRWKYGSEAETAGTQPVSPTPVPPKLNVR